METNKYTLIEAINKLYTGESDSFKSDNCSIRIGRGSLQYSTNNSEWKDWDMPILFDSGGWEEDSSKSHCYDISGRKIIEHMMDNPMQAYKSDLNDDFYNIYRWNPEANSIDVYDYGNKEWSESSYLCGCDIVANWRKVNY